jgi:hypothetical protein
VCGRALAGIVADETEADEDLLVALDIVEAPQLVFGEVLNGETGGETDGREGC